MGKILVIGATGNTGSLLIPALLEAGEEVRAFVRNEEKAESLKKAGAEIYNGDLDEIDTLDNALINIDKVYLCIWNGPTAAVQGINVIKAIKKSEKSPFVVRLSAFGSPQSRIIQQINEVDIALKESQISWCSIKPTFFMQNLLMASQTIQKDQSIYWDWAAGKVGIIDIRDVAESALGALTGRAEHGKEYILTGPESISMHDVANSFTKAIGEEISYVAVPHSAAKEAMLSMGFPEFIVDGYIELNQGFAQNFANKTTHNVELLTDHKPRSVDDFTRDFKSYFVS